MMKNNIGLDRWIGYGFSKFLFLHFNNTVLYRLQRKSFRFKADDDAGALVNTMYRYRGKNSCIIISKIFHINSNCLLSL
uniref:Bm14409 n=1 Tax=Brugia malayi TaxID=6279 RepID=A0A1I9G382_BRUMA|nr:Bm14409 [Brugia malayi]